MTRESDFITVAGQLVREDAVTRLSHNTAAGVHSPQFSVHFVDGGACALSEVEYRRLKKRFSPSTSGRKSA
jgi:hypothetical protein